MRTFHLAVLIAAVVAAPVQVYAAPSRDTTAVSVDTYTPAVSASTQRQNVPTPPADPVGVLIATGTAFAATAGLGALKKYTTIADTAIGNFIKPVQPWLVMALSVAMPLLIHGTPNVPDPSVLVAAPTATLVAVGAAEALRRYFPKAT